MHMNMVNICKEKEKVKYEFTDVPKDTKAPHMLNTTGMLLLTDLSLSLDLLILLLVLHG